MELLPRAPVRSSLKEQRGITLQWAHLQEISEGAGAMWFRWVLKASVSASETPVMEFGDFRYI